MLNTAEEWPEDPHLLFEVWMAEAVEKEPSNPNAMCLATVDENALLDHFLHDQRVSCGGVCLWVRLVLEDMPGSQPGDLDVCF